MKITEILKEAAYSNVANVYDDDIDTELARVIKTLTPYAKQIKEALNATPIYRGMRQSATIILGDGNDLERKSANTQNYYTMLTSNDILESWKGWPKRSKSFICSNNTGKAKIYGNGIFRVIPLENQDIAVATSDDFWDSFPRTYEYGANNLSDFNRLINTLYYKIYYHLNEERDDLSDELEVFTNQLEFIENFFDERDSETLVGLAENEFTSIEEFVKTILHDGGFMRSLNYRLDPKGNGNKLVDLVSQVPPGNNEIWLSGKVLLVQNWIFENKEILETFK